MTCTSCSNTIFRYDLARGLSKLPNVTHVAVCLLTEKVQVKGSGLVTEEIIGRIQALGFDGEEIKEADISQGKLNMIFTCHEYAMPLAEVANQLCTRNGVITAECQEDEVEVQFVPEAIRPRDIVFLVEDLTECRVQIKGQERGSGSMVDTQRKHMNVWLREFLLSAIFTVPIFVMSMILTRLISHKDLAEETVVNTMPLFNLVLWILATPVQFWLGARFYKGAYASLKHRSANMDVLVALSTTSAYTYGVLMSILYMTGFEHSEAMHYIESSHTFETSSLLISIILLGKYLEARSKHKTTDALTKLASLQTANAVLLLGEEERPVDVALLEVDDLVKVFPGSTVPVDGVVTKGNAWVNESMMTGESALVHKTQGKTVFGGTVNEKGFMHVRVTKLGKDSALAHIISLVENAQATKPPIQAVADLISKYFVPSVLGLALLTWIVWFSLTYTMPAGLEERFDSSGESEFLFAFKFGISVLVIACPCALGLAVPTAVMVATGLAAKFGILIKDAEALESAAHIGRVVFDKTGTLTTGKLRVTEVCVLDFEFSEEILWEVVAAVEKNSEHPIAKSLCEGRNTRLVCESFLNVEGEGIFATLDLDGERQVLIGNDRLLQRYNLALPHSTVASKEALESKGQTVITLAIDTHVVAFIALQDEHLVKPEAPETIELLKKQGYEVWMITGDNERCAYAVATAVGIPHSHTIANCYPSDKRSIVKGLQDNNSLEGSVDNLNKALSGRSTVSSGKSGVLFVGDGINDSPSLAQADIGVAIGGTDIAMEASDIVLMKTDLHDVLVALEIAKVTLRRIKYNFFWAFIYNVCGIPLAAGVIYVWTGFYINSLFAAAAMACSSVAVILSSLWLNRFKPSASSVTAVSPSTKTLPN